MISMVQCYPRSYQTSPQVSSAPLGFVTASLVREEYLEHLRTDPGGRRNVPLSLSLFFFPTVVVQTSQLWMQSIQRRNRWVQCKHKFVMDLKITDWRWNALLKKYTHTKPFLGNFARYDSNVQAITINAFFSIERPIYMGALKIITLVSYDYVHITKAFERVNLLYVCFVHR